MDAITLDGTFESFDNQVQGQTVNLIEQKIGFEGLIRGLQGDEVIVTRLRELGFIPGHQIRLKAKAPFGDPIVVEVNGTSIALRTGEAQCIQL